MIWSSIIGVRRCHHLLVAHEVDEERRIGSELQDVEVEDIGSVDGTGEAPDVGVVHLSQVAVQVVEHDRLIQVARGEVGGERCREGDMQTLGDWIQLHGEHVGVVVVASWSEGISMPRINDGVGSLSIWAAHLGRVTPGGCRNRKKIMLQRGIFGNLLTLTSLLTIWVMPPSSTSVVLKEMRFKTQRQHVPDINPHDKLHPSLRTLPTVLAPLSILRLHWLKYK